MNTRLWRMLPAFLLLALFFPASAPAVHFHDSWLDRPLQTSANSFLGILDQPQVNDASPTSFKQLPSPQKPNLGLRYDLKWDLPVTLGGLALWFTLEVTDSLAPANCRWCDSDAQGNNSLNGLDNSLRNSLLWDNPKRAQSFSDLLFLGIAPLTAFGLNAAAAAHDGSFDLNRQWMVESMIILEAAAMTANFTRLLKFAFARERPAVHFGTQDGLNVPDASRNTSFFSGHASMTFSLAAAGGTIASMRGYRWAPLVWAGGMTIAATTGYLRIAGDRHYFTDVLAGAIVGSAVGFAVPYFFHRPRKKTPGNRFSKALPFDGDASLQLPQGASPQKLTIDLFPLQGGGYVGFRWRR